MPKKKKSNKLSKKVRPHYPWDQWLNPERTRSVTITSDKFKTSASVMCQQIYNCAKRRKLKVSLSVVDGSIKIVSVKEIPAPKKTMTGKKKSAGKKKKAA